MKMPSLTGYLLLSAEQVGTFGYRTVRSLMSVIRYASLSGEKGIFEGLCARISQGESCCEGESETLRTVSVSYMATLDKPLVPGTAGS